MNINDELEAIRKRLEKSCKGPWVAEPDDTWWLEGVEHRVVRGASNQEVAFTHDGDAEWIAHSRTDLPRLLVIAEAVVSVHKEVSYGDYTGCLECNTAYYPCRTVYYVNEAWRDGNGRASM